MAAIRSHSQKLTACLWFNNNAEEAVKFYTSVFKNSKKGRVVHYGKESLMPEGTVLTISFQIAGQKFLALNGGAQYKFNEAVSFIVNCQTQKEIDFYWERLSIEGEKIGCGWLKDRFGVFWQVVPEIISEMMTDENEEKSSRVMQAILQMNKLDMLTLKQAYSTQSKS